MMTQQVLMLVLALLILAFGTAARRPAAAWPWAGGLLAGLLLFAPWPGAATAQPVLLVEATQAGLLLALLAAGRLRGRLTPTLTLIAGGGLGGLWLQCLATLAYPPFLQWLLTAALMLAAPLCSLWHPPYRAQRTVDDALLLSIGAGLVLAVLPGLLDGWRTALGLHQGLQGEAAADAPWIFVIAAACLALGALRVQWQYRRRAA